MGNRMFKKYILTSVQRMRDVIKNKIVLYYQQNGIPEVRPWRPSDKLHPYISLCKRSEMELGLYLSDQTCVWQFLRVNSPYRDLDVQVMALCSGKPIETFVIENNKHSRYVAKITRYMDWKNLTLADYGLLSGDCRLLMDIMNTVCPY